jgi:hypothetical protein
MREQYQGKGHGSNLKYSTWIKGTRAYLLLHVLGDVLLGYEDLVQIQLHKVHPTFTCNAWVKSMFD